VLFLILDREKVNTQKRLDSFSTIMASTNNEVSSNIKTQHHSLPHKKRKDSHLSLESNDSHRSSVYRTSIVVDASLAAKVDGDSSSSSTRNDHCAQKEVSEATNDFDDKRQTAGYDMRTKSNALDDKTDITVSHECKLSDSESNSRQNEAGAYIPESSSSPEIIMKIKDESKVDITSSCEPASTTKNETSIDDGSDRSMKSNETEFAELVSEAEMLTKCNDLSREVAAKSTVADSEIIDIQTSLNKGDKSNASTNGPVPKFLEKQTTHFETEIACTDQIHDNSFSYKEEFHAHASKDSKAPEATKAFSTRGGGILRRRSASDEQKGQEIQESNHTSLRFGKKRSYSEVCAPPKFKVHFTRRIEIGQDRMDEKKNSKAMHENDDNDSQATVSVVCASATAGICSSEKVDGESMRPPRNRVQSLDFSLAETSVRSSIELYGFDDFSSAGTFSSKIPHSTTSSGRNIMFERRLPSKKRKESHDLLAQRHQLRKGSYDLSVSFGDGPNDQQRPQSKALEDSYKRIRKGSHDISVTFEDVKRVRADSTASLIIDVLLSPRKYSSDANSIANLTALGDPSDYTIEVKTDADHIRLDDHDENGSLHHTSQLDMSGLDDIDEEKKPNSRTKAPTFPLTLDNDDSCESHGTFDSSSRPILLSSSLHTTGSGASALVPDPDKSTSGMPIANTIDQSSLAVASMSARRERLESWGAMSDLSLPYGSDSALMVNLLGAWQQSDGANAEQSPSIEQVLFMDDNMGSIPPRILMGIRSRLNSIASLSEASLGDALPPLATSTHHSEMIVDVGGHIEDCVVAAMATVEDDIAALASAVENAADFGFEFDENSHIDLMVAQFSTDAACETSSLSRNSKRPRSWSTSSGMISVDYNAVQAAVEAAEAAKETLGLAGLPEKKEEEPFTAKETLAKTNRRKLPLKRNSESFPLPSANSESDAIKSSKRSRPVAEGQVAENVAALMTTPAPTEVKSAAAPKKPKRTSTVSTKRRGRQEAATGPQPVLSTDAGVTTSAPEIKKATGQSEDDSGDDTANVQFSCSKAAKQAKQTGQSNQKWESMYNCLVEYANIRKVEDTASLSEKEKETWVWDGNVPTNYKSKDGKALGRWVNNQRSAKSKGTLKEDREERLIDAGLKWSVMASNSWNLMLNELTVYINEQTSKGITWDGNVPTNYQIKTKLDSEFAGEDKNLGRWVNRQRSMYQAGKLRKARQLELEKIGLKWSMLATTSWDSMFETLEKYVSHQTKDSNVWDGNVPANYKTDDNPPRSLGRWINRQRSAFIKRKLKQEYIDKLNAIGLKWSVHHRHGDNGTEDCDDFDSDKDDDYNFDCGEQENCIEMKIPIADLPVSSIAPDCMTSTGVMLAVSVGPSIEGSLIHNDSKAKVKLDHTSDDIVEKDNISVVDVEGQKVDIANACGVKIQYIETASV
jgi:Helicase associated domain